MKIRFSYFNNWKEARKEKRLIRRLARGDKAAFKQLVEENFDELYHYLVIRVKHVKVARALMKGVYLKLWHDRKSLKPRNSFSHHAIEIARDAVFNYYRTITHNKEALRELSRIVGLSRNFKDEIKEYDFVIKTVQHNLRRKQLTYKLTAQGG